MTNIAIHITIGYIGHHMNLPTGMMLLMILRPMRR